MKRKEYEKHLHKLQVELCRLQDWVKAEGAKAIVLFEGRDAAGQGHHGTREPARFSCRRSAGADRSRARCIFNAT